MPRLNSFIAHPGRASYSASKFAIEAVHESLSYEVSTFGIKVLIVEPGAFHTPFACRIITPAQYDDTNGFSEAYKNTAVSQMIGISRNLTSIPDWCKGDPDKAAHAILNAVTSGHTYLRLPLGPDCVAALQTKIGELQADLDATRSTAVATNAD
jgi:short-subunit dehydrogenase